MTPLQCSALQPVTIIGCQQGFELPQQLWLHRNSAAFRDEQQSTHSIAAKAWATVKHQTEALAAAKRTDSVTYEFGRALKILWDELDVDTEVQPGTNKQVRLYYDGGARGNPGVSGAGSILIERAPSTATWTVVWWAARYLGDTGTNNMAEHTALAIGLKEAAQRYGTTTDTIVIIGDSMLATRQLLLQARTTCSRLTAAIATSRKALRQLYDYKFHHTLRAGNTAADWLANKAMDERQSTSSLKSEITDYATTMTNLTQRVDHDTMHAYSEMTHPQDVLTSIRTAAAKHEHHELPSRKRPRPIALTRTTSST